MPSTDINKSLADFDEITENILSNLLLKVSNDFNNSNNHVLIKLDESLNELQEKVNPLPTNAGVYLFEINLQSFYTEQLNSFIEDNHSTKIKKSKIRDNFYEHLKKSWLSNTRNNSKHPKLIRKRFKYHYSLRPYRNNFESNEWIPLYLGISHNIQERILEHINCDSDTYSMKLLHLSETAFKEIPIRVSTSVIPNIELNRRYMIVKEIETILREKLHPLVGKQ